MRFTLLFLSLAAPLAASAALAQTGPGDHPPVPRDFPLPGYWEMTTKYESIISGGSTDRRCYGPADVPKLVQPCNHHYDCTYSTQDAKNGHLTLKGQWVAKKGGQTIDVSGAGAYSPESLTAHADMRTTLLGIPLSGTGEIAAHRLSATCPADAKKG
jgi:hypothetical protein